MAQRCPLADYRPLGAQTEPLMRAHDIVCLHTMVGYLVSTDRYFRDSNGHAYDGTESHYGIGGKWGPDLGGGLDGALWQWQDRARQADANGEGNPRIISVETADNGAEPIQRWTSAQAAMIVRLLVWECSREAHAGCPSTWRCHTEGIPAVLVPDSKPGRRGIGYHRQGIDPWRAAGGERWSAVYGKRCPTDARVRQLRDEIIPAVQQGGSMALSDDDLVEIGNKIDDRLRAGLGMGDPPRVGTFRDRVVNDLGELLARDSGGDTGGPTPINVVISDAQLDVLADKLAPRVADVLAARLQD